MRGDEFLGRLTGRWELRGLMGNTVLHQAVESRWALGDRFVEMRFRELDGTPYRSWSHFLSSIDPDGRATTFATKHLTRI